MDEQSLQQSEEFVPKGAITFFLLLLLLYLLMWGSVYFELIERGS